LRNILNGKVGADQKILAQDVARMNIGQPLLIPDDSLRSGHRPRLRLTSKT
jgi:hypothetical protein